MIRSAALASLVALTACAGAIPVRFDTVDHSPQELEDLAIAIEFTIGHPIEIVDTGRGAITVHLLRVEPGWRQGFYTERENTQCRRWVVATSSPDVAAHEILHALGLGHVCDRVRGDGFDDDLEPCSDEHRRYLINPSTEGGTYLDADERALMEREISDLLACPGPGR